MPKIALFERSDKMGGRLMSGYGAGALNLGVGPMTKELYKQPEPMPEYGGMRINPQLYPLVMNRIAYFSRVLFGEHTPALSPVAISTTPLRSVTAVRRCSRGWSSGTSATCAVLALACTTLLCRFLYIAYHYSLPCQVYVISDVSHLSMAHLCISISGHEISQCEPPDEEFDH